MRSLSSLSLIPATIALATVALAVGAYALWVEPRRVVPRAVAVPCHGVGSELRLLVYSDVDFPAGRELLREVRAQRERFAPHVVLVAGDLVDAKRALRSPRLLREAGLVAASLAGPAACLVAPGEAETAGVRRLRDAWRGLRCELVVNEARRVQVGGQVLDVFVADPQRDPAPWSLGRVRGRPFATSRGRPVHAELLWSGGQPIDWSDADVTFAFQTTERRSYLDVRLAWTAPAHGYRIVRSEYRPAFRLRAVHPGPHRLTGEQVSRFVPAPRQWYRARIRVREESGATRVQARFWPEGGTEPRRWAIDVRDAGERRPRGGTVGWGGRQGGRRVADVRITSPAGTIEERFEDAVAFEQRWRYRSGLRDWLRLPHAGQPRLLLAHNPDVAIDVAAIGARPPCLLVAGHTHGGQIRIPLLGPLHTGTHLPRSHAAGLTTYRGVRLYVTRGVGTSVLPLRLGVPPEVTLLRLVAATEEDR